MIKDEEDLGKKIQNAVGEMDGTAGKLAQVFSLLPPDLRVRIIWEEDPIANTFSTGGAGLILVLEDDGMLQRGAYLRRPPEFQSSRGRVGEN